MGFIYAYKFCILLVNLVSLFNLVSSNEVLGCGGFIKSHTEIDFSKIEIKLYTKQGNLKDKTDCSPSNGYYFLPVYDKGEYILKISPPAGWSFEPEQVELNFNGRTDICSLGKDVNFIFKGFGITGKVYLANQNIGVKDVSVELQSKNDTNLRKTTTDINGVFSFTPIIPGNYLIKASHDRWYFSKSEYSVLVEGGNTELPQNSIVVSGFDVEGRIGDHGQKFNNIGVVLFKEKKQQLNSNCNNNLNEVVLSSTLLLKEKSNYDEKQICSIRPDKNGIFIFNGVPPGKYLLLPTPIDIKDLKLNIKPEFIKFKVEKDIVILKDTFEIIGFSVSGKVISSSVRGHGIADVEIKLNGAVVTKTDSDGNFVLENIKTGLYKIQVISDSYKFNEQNVEISFSNLSLPHIIASSYKVCGQVVSENLYTVSITKNDDPSFHVSLSTNHENGEWCTFLLPGKYIVEVVTTDVDKQKGIQFFPLKQKIDVHNSPVSGILFSQLRVTLTGEVICLPDSSSNCKNVEVTLQAIDSTGLLTDEVYVTTAKNGKYEFKNILPSPYEISIPQSNLCWESTKKFLNIMTAIETAPPFIHKGYEVSIISSHHTKMQYTLRTNQKSSSVTKQMNLMSGVNTFCVENPGEYDIQFIGCHKYDLQNVPKQFSTNNKNPIIVTAISHKIGVRILSTEPDIDTFKMLIQTHSTKETVQLIKESQKVDGYYSYLHNLYLKPDNKIILRPQSNRMLFKPELKEITGGNDCIDIAFNFIAIKGLIIHGKIQPQIKDVKIILTFPKNPDLQSLQTQSTSNGEFNFGPIDGNLEISLKAQKESYTFSEYDFSTNTFKAHKLCDVIVNVKDDTGNKLFGVLLSLSGAESYRKNLITGDDGTIKFHSLTPSQYFLRPMMKEYKFNPNSKLIDVKNGETVTVELIGKRVAFSVFGKISSLNGDVFPNVMVEAISDENCMYHQEESSSETNGQYRIRGLQPDCTYTIQIKQNDNINLNVIVERSIPSLRTIKIQNNDIRDINLIAISPIGIVDVIAKVTTSTIEHYKTLRIQMYRKGNSDNLIYFQRIELPQLLPKSATQQQQQLYNNRHNNGVKVYLPRIPLDGKTYIINIKTTLSDKIYKYTVPSVHFLANTSSIYVTLDFKTEIKSNDNEIHQNSLSALILIALIGIAFFKQDLAIDLFNFVWNRINTIVQELIAHRNEIKKKNINRYSNEQINYKEIEQLAEGINSIKKKKAKKI